MRIVGLTGGIGSGKTAVSKVFADLGVPVFYADVVAKELYNEPEVIVKVQNILGEVNIVNETGQLNGSKIASIIFEDESKRKNLNALLHPLVKMRFDKWTLKHQHIYCIREAAILIESGAYADCDKIIVVTCPLELRVKRVMKRDNSSQQEVESRIAAQMSEEERLKYADYIIVNDRKEEDLYEEVLKIHHQLI